MQIVFILVAALIALASYIVNRDLLSPAKIFLLVLFVFLGDIFVGKYGADVQLTFGCLLLAAAFGVALEARLTQRFRKIASIRLPPFKPGMYRRAILIIWLATIAPLLAQLYMIWIFGGLEGYIATIPLRVVEWRGFGFARIVINVLYVVHAAYFAVVISSRSRIASFPYLIHFALMVAVALLSGSRGNLVTTLFLLLLCYHYFRQPLSVAAAGAAGLVLIAVILLLGIARTNTEWTSDDGLQTGLEAEEWNWGNTAVSAYGLRPLQLVYSRPPQELKFGLTFATAVTNFVPRRIWAGKPDPGGLVLTKDYLSDRWAGASNISTGIIAEMVLNFGQWAAVLGILSVVSFIYLNFRLYVRVLRAKTNADCGSVMGWTLLYGIAAPAICGFLFMEFTNNVVILVTRLIPVAVLLTLILRRNPWASRRAVPQ